MSSENMPAPRGAGLGHGTQPENLCVSLHALGITMRICPFQSTQSARTRIARLNMPTRTAVGMPPDLPYCIVMLHCTHRAAGGVQPNRRADRGMRPAARRGIEQIGRWRCAPPALPRIVALLMKRSPTECRAASTQINCRSVPRETSIVRFGMTITEFVGQTAQNRRLRTVLVEDLVLAQLTLNVGEPSPD